MFSFIKTLGHRINILSIIKGLTFLSLFIVATVLSYNLYTGLADGPTAFIIMAVVSIATEGLKVVAVTWAKTAQWQATTIKSWYIDDFIKGLFKRRNRKSIRKGKLLKAVISYDRHKRLGFGMYAVYILTAFLSISASFGFISQSVYKSTQGKIIVSTSSQETIYQEQLASVQDIIEQDRKLNVEYDKAQSKLDINDTQYQSKYDSYQRKIDKNNSDIQQKLKDKETINTKLQQVKINDQQNNAAFGKNMYQLMGETFGIPESTVRFILLYLLAFIIEIGIFITSPHLSVMDHEDMEEMPDELIPSSSTNDKIPVKSQENNESMIKVIDELKNSIISSTTDLYKTHAFDIEELKKTVVSIPTLFANTLTKEEMDFFVNEVMTEIHNLQLKLNAMSSISLEDVTKITTSLLPSKKPVEESNAKESDAKDNNEFRLLQNVESGVSTELEIPIDTSSKINVETPVDIPLNIPAHKSIDKSKAIDNFLNILFDETGKMKDRDEIAEEVGLSKIHAIKITDYITQQKGLVTFRVGKGWYRATTLDIIKRAIGELYGN